MSEPAATEPRVGDLVVCGSKPYRESAGLDLEVGLYVVQRRRDGLVYYGRREGSAWIPRATLVAVSPDDPRVLAPPGWLLGVHRAMRRVDAVDVALEPDDDGEIEVRIGCGAIDAGTLRDLEALVGPRAAATLTIAPGSMSRLLVRYRPRAGGGSLDSPPAASY